MQSTFTVSFPLQIVMTYEGYRNALFREIEKKKQQMGIYPAPPINNQQQSALSQNVETKV